MSETILVAHRNTAEGRALTELLRETGLAPVEAADRTAVLAMLEQRPALLLLELGLAREEGFAHWEATLALCKEHDLSCLLFSAGREALDRRSLPLQPTEGLIPRPDQPDVVLPLIENHLTIRRLQIALRGYRLRMEEKKRRLDDALLSAAHIQQSLLPKRLPMLGSLRLASRFLPCEMVGGDLFNVIQLDEETVMAYVLDVSGHGISSAMLTVSVYQSLSLHTGRVVKRAFAAPPYYRIQAPAEVLEELDLEYPFERFEMFFTITYLLINTATGQVLYSNAGHPPPILVRTNGAVELLRQGGPLIGMKGLPPFNEGVVMLGPGDRLFLYSDGIPEYMNRKGEFFGEDRLIGELLTQNRVPLETGCENLIENLYRFGENVPLQDDVTLLGIEYL